MSNFTNPFRRLLGTATCFLLLSAGHEAQAQVGIGTTSPDAAAVLDLSATNKGLLIPRLTQAQRTAIASPPDGLMVFQTDNTTGFWYYFGGAWLNLPNATTAGDNLGNHTATQNLNLGANALVGNGGSSGITLSSNGRLGLGIASPTARVHSQATSTGTLNDLDNDYVLEDFRNGRPITQYMVQRAANGTAAAPAALGDGTTTGINIGGYMFAPRLSTGYPGFGYAEAGLEGMYRGDGTTNLTELRFKTSSGIRMVLDPTGQLGIGTTSPTALLDVSGPARVRSLTATGTQMVTADADGNLGATTLPTDAQQLSISGATISLTNGGSVTVPALADNLGDHTATQNLALGANALTGTGSSVGSAVGVGVRADGGLNLGQNTTGNVIALGYQAGQSNTTGIRNQFSGYQAGSQNTTGNNNLALGYQALNTASTASNNTAVGALSQLVSTGGSNTSVGASSMAANTSGFNNLAAGSSALAANTTGGSNTAVGASAMQFNTTGNANTAMGFAALNSANSSFSTAIGYFALQPSTGSANTAIGGFAMKSNTSGGNNTAIGYNVLNSNTTGIRNTAVGDLSLGLNSTGSTNVGIGYRAGYNALGGGNVFIGYEAGYNETGSGKLYVANSSTTSPLLYGDFSSGYVNVNSALGVGLGNAAPAATLHVAGGSSTVRLEGLSGTGTRMVTADASGNLSTAAVPADTDAQQLSLSGSTLNLTNGGSVTIPSAVADNLGDHTATQNISLGTNTITGNGSTTGLGISAQGNLTTGSTGRNIGVGSENMESITSGTNNLAIGYQAGKSLTTGSNNMAVGYTAGTALTTGSSNTIYGSQAGTVITTGTDNSFFGYAAGQGTVNGISNTAIGYSAGVTNTTGNRNTFIGNRADASSSGLSNATAIGANARVATSHSLVLGGTGSSYVNVGIGTASPAYTLHIGGTTSTVRLEGLSGTGTRVVTADADGDLSTTTTASLADNLGSHTATQALNLAANKLVGNGGTTGISVSSTGNVTTDAALTTTGAVTVGGALTVNATTTLSSTVSIAGGTSASPTLLSASAFTYLGLAPASATANNYRLPAPASNPGRMYVIRNNSGTNAAVLTTASGLLYSGNSNTGASSYTLPTNADGKTLIVFSDGTNWTVGQLN